MRLPTHNRLAYSDDETRKLLGGFSQSTWMKLKKEHRVMQFRIGQKPYTPSFEIDRVIEERLREESRRRITSCRKS